MDWFLYLLSKSMVWFLYDNGFRHERVKYENIKDASIPNIAMWQQLPNLTKINFLGILYLFSTI